MRVLIQPFEQVNGGIGWEGAAVAYVWGKLAVELGEHFDGYNDSEDWEEGLEAIEERLLELASETLGTEHHITLAPEYI